MTIGILGGGVWGSALARVLSNNKVIIYARDEKIVKSINEHKINPKLKYSSFNENVTEISSSKFLTDVFQEMMPFKSISILSGPSFSNEVSQSLPTAVTLATKDKKDFENISKLIPNKEFRIYYSNDLIGTQIGGALKNIYAIAAGIAEGLNLGENAKSALISRSFAEMARYAKKFKADKNTLFGLSGLGDLILTCSSKNSRNTQFGIKLASSKYDNFLDLLKSQEVTEGYYTVHDLKEELSNLLSRPITEEKI